MSKRKMPSDRKIIELYTTQNKSAGEICKMYKMASGSRSGILKVLKANNVEIRKDVGENHHNWKGGRISKGDGYIGIWQSKHKRADRQGYVYEHTLVYEKEKGVLPNKDEVIHHIDMDKHNNKIENLYLCSKKTHLQIHRKLEKLVNDLINKGIVEFENGEYILK